MEKVRIRLQDISKSYYSETAVTQALRKVSLTFYSREFVAITGESGSGKSTLLNVIGGMDAFDDGEMYVDGEPTFQYDDADWEDYRRNKIGYVFQDYSLVGHYSALDNVLSALLIMDSDMEKAKRTATDYLGQVGLSGYENQRASELSSGQKQRLSIARALAKNTGIIVADEPTGNLDSETGEQIIKLLKELSKDRLVIMVTHNYSQVEPYVTRKIRIHDGVVVSDTSINAEDESSDMDGDKVHNESVSDNDKQTNDRIAENNEKQNAASNKIAAFFARRNQVTQLGRSFLFTVFLLVVSIVSFLFVGEIFSHADDTLTKEYSNNAFYHEDDKRLVVGRKDGGEITDEDVEKISGVRNVVTVDKYDIVNDINYYIEKDRDYKFIYGNAAKRSKMSSGTGEVKTIQFLNTDHFMMSAGCIDEDDLKSGKLPEARNEIVMYSEDESVLDTEIECYFTALNYWEANQYYVAKYKVVGLLKEETEQVYFSDALCDMFTAYSNSYEFRLCGSFKKDWGDRTLKFLALLLINDELKDDEIKVSSKYDPKKRPAGNMVAYTQKYDEDGNEVGEPIEKAVTVVEKNTESTDLFMEVSENTFKEFYEFNSYQASVYLTSYAMTDKVIKKLDKMGYKAVSTYRLSATGYVEELVNERILLLGISVFGLIAIMFAEILILRSLMKIRIKDYFVLKFIGMRMQTIRKIGYYEIIGYGVIALIVTVLAMWVLRLSGVEFIQDIMWYYSAMAYVLFVIYNFLLWLLTVMSFNRILKGRLNS